MKRIITLEVNGDVFELLVEPNATLLEVLRDHLKLKSVKEGCGMGECGACTVLVDGEPVSSCIMLAVDADGRKVETVEGLSQGGDLHPIQKAFIEEHAFQRGFCIPGMIMTAKALLDKNPRPTVEDVKEIISGSLCRCTGYTPIVRAILKASGRGV